MPQKFGRLIAIDDRDSRYPMRLMLDPLRAQFFPSGLPIGTRHYRQGPVLDQGNTGTCVGHGWRGWLNGAPIMTRTGPSPFELYRQFVAIDEWSENDSEANGQDEDLQFGTSVRAGAKVLQNLGHVQNYLWAESAEDVRAWHLAGFGGVVLGVNWYTDMMNTDSEGFIHVRGWVEGGHCVKTTGWSDERDATRILNSWGRPWGENGRAWLSRYDLARLLEEQGECCAAVEQKVAPING